MYPKTSKIEIELEPMILLTPWGGVICYAGSVWSGFGVEKRKSIFDFEVFKFWPRVLGTFSFKDFCPQGAGGPDVFFPGQNPIQPVPARIGCGRKFQEILGEGKTLGCSSLAGQNSGTVQQLICTLGTISES